MIRVPRDQWYTRDVFNMPAEAPAREVSKRREYITCTMFSGQYQFLKSYNGQFVLPQAIRLVNPDPPAITLVNSMFPHSHGQNPGLHSSSCPLTTPMARGSPFHHPNMGPPELPGVKSAFVSISSPPLESPLVSSEVTLP